MSRSFAARALFACAALAFAATEATADTPTLLGVSQNWSAFTQGSGSAKTCYAISKPTATSPKKKRDPIYFLITDWPGRRTKSEPEVVPGYQYKDGAPITAAVGPAKFELFSKNDGGQGAAWVRERADEIKLIEAMKQGQSLVVAGTSLRGTRTTDTYSLAGLSDALDKIHAACGF
ncbi:MAG: invasion associated locus B family protein [Rhizomicrobium sp.]